MQAWTHSPTCHQQLLVLPVQLPQYSPVNRHRNCSISNSIDQQGGEVVSLQCDVKPHVAVCTHCIVAARTRCDGLRSTQSDGIIVDNS
jgi:hypothetical protein